MSRFVRLFTVARQIPSPKGHEQTIRVQMDRAELQSLLGPILAEVNTLRARVAKLETIVGLTQDDGR